MRAALPEHYRAIWEAGAEAFQDHWGYVQPTEEEYQDWLNKTSFFQPHLWQVGWDVASDQVAGQVETFINHLDKTKSADVVNLKAILPDESKPAGG